MGKSASTINYLIQKCSSFGRCQGICYLLKLAFSDPALSRCPQEQRNSSYYRQRIVTSPDTIAQLDSQLVHSGVAILPGEKDFSFPLKQIGHS